MPRQRSPEVRRALIERAAAMLANREPVTAAALVRACGVSTTALYTYFDGMPGLWSAVRQEGFARLASRLADVVVPRDPVRHLAVLGVVYLANAMANPDLYRVMFESRFELLDPEQAARTFEPLVEAAERAQEVGHFDRRHGAADIATRYWAYGHGLASLVVTGVLEAAELARHARHGTRAWFVDAGDSPEHALRAIDAAWSATELG
jgi:AcrR family transcriptional regulator